MKKEICILGTTYRVETRELKNEWYDGFCDYTEKLIVLREDNCNDVGNFEELMKKQFRHEIIHAFMAESGLQSNWKHNEEYGHDETTVDWFAIQFPKIVRVFEECGIL